MKQLRSREGCVNFNVEGVDISERNNITSILKDLKIRLVGIFSTWLIIPQIVSASYEC